MSTIGHEFRITFFGESQGRCISVVIDGCPAGLPLSEKDIQPELNKRRPGISKVVSPRKEEDKVEILSGVFKGFTTGAPICLLIWNKEFEEAPYEEFRKKPRPGHADYPAFMKYKGFSDYRGGGIFSGRITAAFVAAGAVAKKILATRKIEVLAHAIEIGGIRITKVPPFSQIRREVYRNPVRCADPVIAKKMESAILKAKEEGDSVGGIVEGIALNVPVGIGSPIFDSLDADIAKFLFDIPGVKGVEFGVGFEAARLRGSEYSDPYVIRGGRVVTLTNQAGGIVGGLSTGMPIIVRVAFKPTSSIRRKQRTVDLEKMEETEIKISGAYDPCIVPRAVPVVESALAIVLTDHLIRDQVIPKVLR